MPDVQSSRDIIIRTGSFTEALRFYGETLGFTVSSRAEGIVGFDTGSFRLYVEKGAAHGPVFEYLVPDVRQMRDLLVRAGCTVVEEDPALPRCYLRDPYGMTFNIGRRP